MPRQGLGMAGGRRSEIKEEERARPRRGTFAESATRRPQPVTDTPHASPRDARYQPAHLPLRYSATAAISSAVIFSVMACITALSFVRSRLLNNLSCASV